MTTEERLEKVERELARAKSRTRWLLIIVVVCLGVGILVWALGSGAAIITAKAFLVVDSEGRQRAGLTVTSDGPLLGLTDENETTRAGLSALRDGPMLGFWDENGEVLWGRP